MRSKHKQGVPPVRPASEVAEDWEDARLAIQEFGGWVKNADSKITVLAAVVGVTISVLGAKSSDIASAFTSGPRAALIVLTISALSAVVFLAATGVSVLVALSPRVGRNEKHHTCAKANRFSWPDVARGLEVPPDAENLRDEAWRQAVVLAGIARAKYRAFKVSVALFVVTLVALMFAIGSSAWINVS